MSQHFDKSALNRQLKKVAKHLGQMQALAVDFPPNGNKVLCSKINEVVHDLKDLQGIIDPLNDVKVPIDVLAYIDEGKKPNLFTKKMLETAEEENKRTKATIDGFRELKAKLTLELFKTFPKEMSYYRAYRMNETKDEREDDFVLTL